MRYACALAVLTAFLLGGVVGCSGEKKVVEPAKVAPPPKMPENTRIPAEAAN